VRARDAGCRRYHRRMKMVKWTNFRLSALFPFSAGFMPVLEKIIARSLARTLACFQHSTPSCRDCSKIIIPPIHVPVRATARVQYVHVYTSCLLEAQAMNRKLGAAFQAIIDQGQTQTISLNSATKEDREREKRRSGADSKKKIACGRGKEMEKSHAKSGRPLRRRTRELSTKRRPPRRPQPCRLRLRH
jgi:hypothetical protein